MGTQKLLLPIRGKPMIEHVLDAASAYPTILVTSDAVAGAIASRSGLTIVINTEPHLGMAHSLALANDAAAGEAVLLVFLGDKPLVSADLAERIVQGAVSNAADVAFPERDGVGGHPVFFSRNARAKIGGTGDSLRTIRDDASLRRLALPIEDNGAYADVDDPVSLSRAREQI